MASTWGPTDSYYTYTLSGSTYTQGVFSATGATYDDDIAPGDNGNDFDVGEQISGDGGAFTVTYVGYLQRADGKYIVTFDGAIYYVDAPAGGGADYPPTFDTADLILTSLDFCFAPGTMITTPGGEVAVEDLDIGDEVCTAEGTVVPVKWIGLQEVDTQWGFTEKREPVLIGAGALGGDLPHSDLIVSADHGMILDGMVVNASALVNGTTIRFVPAEELEPVFTYYHIETEAHDVILANGAPAETFVDIPGRMAFDNYQDYLDLYGTERIIPEMRMMRITAQRLLPDALRARLGIPFEDFAFEPTLLTA